MGITALQCISEGRTGGHGIVRTRWEKQQCHCVTEGLGGGGGMNTGNRKAARFDFQQGLRGAKGGSSAGGRSGIPGPGQGGTKCGKESHSEGQSNNSKVSLCFCQITCVLCLGFFVLFFETGCH